MPCSEKSNPARVSLGVSSSNSPRTLTVSSIYVSIGAVAGNTKSVNRLPVRMVTLVVDGLLGVALEVSAAAAVAVNAVQACRNRRTAQQPAR